MLLRERSPSAHIATGMTIPLLAASGSEPDIDKKQTGIILNKSADAKDKSADTD